LTVNTIFRVLAGLFALLLACIICAANLDAAGAIFGPIYAFPYGDKIAHFVLMGTLSLLVSLGIRPRRFLGLLLYSVIILCFLVTLEELSQIPLRNRDFSLTDLASNYAGIWLFGEAGALIRRVLVREKEA